MNKRLSILIMVLAMMFGTALLVQAAPAVANPPPDLIGAKVAFVEITGASKISPDTILAATRLKPGDIWTADKIRQDLRLIYEMGTFADVTADFTLIPEGVKVVYNVKENPILKSIAVQGNAKVAKQKILSFMTVKTGTVMNSKTVADNLRAVEDYYKGQGYILVKIGDVNMAPDGVLTVQINEGLVEDVVVKGNVKTKAYVVTREMLTKKGQPFNSKEARRSMQKLYNLGYFEDVNLKLAPGTTPGGTVLEVTVVEQKTGTFTVGGGYSASDGIVGIITVGDKNFRGVGDNINVHWEFGGNTGTAGNYNFTYTKPWIDSKQTSLGFSLYNIISQYTDYDTDGNSISTYNRRYRGFDITMGRPVNDSMTNFITLKNRWDEYVQYVSGVDYSSDPAYAPNYLPNNFGLTRSIILSRVFDSRDNANNPSSGTRYGLNAEFAGFGGDFSFNKYSAEIRHYWKAGKTQVIAVRGYWGYGTGQIPSMQLFTAGGINTIRGYRDDQFKGNRELTATVEYRFPITKRVQGAFFVDMGDAWGDTWQNGGLSYQNFQLNVGYGVGFSIITPFGPVRIDYGIGSQGGRTHFNFGGKF